MKVYVLSKENKPLMPTVPAIARLLLKSKKARVVSRMPFTIKLTYKSQEYLQPLVMGIDPGSSVLSIAVRVENTPKIIYVSEVKVRNDISRKLKQRNTYRRNRRYRKTRYRKPRFLNRKRKDKWLPPSLVSKFNSHKKEIKFIFSILPISRIILERNTFDTHKLVNPNVYRYKYQQGTLFNYENHRQYVLNRDGHRCKICRNKNVPLQTHHIILRSKGGRDHFSNLITLCDSCHNKVHSGKLKLSKKLLKDIGKSINTKDATHSNIINKRLCEFLENHKEKKKYSFYITFGYETVVKRRLLHLKKTHYNDAISISYPKKEYYPKRIEVFNLYRKISVSKGDYKQTFGSRSEKKIPTGKIQGFRKFDTVKYKGKRYIIKGRYSRGYVILMNSKMETIKLKPMAKLKLLKRVKARNTIILKERKRKFSLIP